MKPAFIVVSIAFLAVTGCKDLGSNIAVVAYEDDIREAVFRYQFSHNESGQQQTAAVYFIGLYSAGDSLHPGYYTDPSENLLVRFLGTAPPVKRVSECTQSVDGVFDIHSGARGLLFRIESIGEISADEVEVRGGYFEAGLSASGNVYTLKRIGGNWVVIQDLLLWIS